MAGDSENFVSGLQGGSAAAARQCRLSVASHFSCRYTGASVANFVAACVSPAACASGYSATTCGLSGLIGYCGCLQLVPAAMLAALLAACLFVFVLLACLREGLMLSFFTVADVLASDCEHGFHDPRRCTPK